MEQSGRVCARSLPRAFALIPRGKLHCNKQEPWYKTTGIAEERKGGKFSQLKKLPWKLWTSTWNPLASVLQNLKAVPGPGNGQDSISNNSRHGDFLHWTSLYPQIPSNIFKHGLLFYRYCTNPLNRFHLWTLYIRQYMQTSPRDRVPLASNTCYRFISPNSLSNDS